MNLYVYGFVPISKASRRQMRLHGRRIELRRCARIDVAVERREERPPMTERALRTQHAIVEQLATRFDAVLPARFGSLLPVEDLERLVKARRSDLTEALRSVRKRVQMTVRITAPGAAITSRTGSPTSGTAYLNARRAAVSAAPPSSIAALTEAVADFVRDERVEANGEQGRTVLFHLVDRGDVERYRASIARVAIPAAGRVTVTGPFPPFAFAPELWP
jgi:hypothetical protein